MKKLILIIILGITGTLFLVKAQSDKSGAVKTELSRQEKDAIIERALALDLPVTDAVVSQEANQLHIDIFKKVRAAQYEEAIDVTMSGLCSLPHNFLLQADLGMLLSDCAIVCKEISSPLKEKMQHRAEEIFEKLTHSVDSQPRGVYYRFKNEYYFHFGLHKEQYQLGLARVDEFWGTNEWLGNEWVDHNARGYYYQGVGAARYAKKLLEQGGDRSIALDYAQKAVVAWAQYFSYTNDYYNAYVHYALALGILGNKKEMMRALERSASFIKKDMTYFEFKEVIDFVEAYA